MMILIITNSIVLGVQAGEPTYAWFIVTVSFLYCFHTCLEKYVRYIMTDSISLNFGLDFTRICFHKYTFSLNIVFHVAEISKVNEPSLNGLKLCLQIFDYCTLTIFVLEIVLKWIDGFWTFWNNGWNIFDFIVTLMVGTTNL